MIEEIKYAGLVFFWVVVTVVVAVFLSLLGYASYEYFAPRYTAVDNKVYHESQQYNDGKIQRLEDFQQAYMTADAAGKATIKSTVQHEFAEYPDSQVPDYLRSFLDDMRK